MRHTPALCKHASHEIVFILLVDGFGVNYTCRQDTEHLRNSLRVLYAVNTYCTGLKVLGLTLKWDYINRTFNLSMPNYISEELHKLQNKGTDKPQDSPHLWNRQTYGQAMQHAYMEDTSLLLPPNKSTWYRKLLSPSCTIFWPSTPPC